MSELKNVNFDWAVFSSIIRQSRLPLNPSITQYLIRLPRSSQAFTFWADEFLDSNVNINALVSTESYSCFF